MIPAYDNKLRARREADDHPGCVYCIIAYTWKELLPTLRLRMRDCIPRPPALLVIPAAQYKPGVCDFRRTAGLDVYLDVIDVDEDIWVRAAHELLEACHFTLYWRSTEVVYPSQGVMTHWENFRGLETCFALAARRAHVRVA